MEAAAFRRSMGAGIAFVVLFLVGVFTFFGNAPSIKRHDSDAVAAAKYVKQLSSSGHRAGLIVGAYLILLAGIAFIWFTAGLRTRSDSVIGQRMVSGLGVLGAGAMAAAAMSAANVAGSVSFGNEPVPQDGDAIRVVTDLAFPFLFVVFGVVAAATIATVAITARRSGLPTWILNTAWLGVLGAILGVIFIPMLVALLWFLAVAIIGATRGVASPVEV